MRKNKQEKFEKLYTEYKDTVFRIAVMYLKDYQLAEDAAHEVFFKALKKLSSLRDESKAKAWILSITVNICRDRLRHSSRKEVSMDSLPEAPANEADTDLKLTVSQVVSLLAPELREVVILYYYQELRQTEIAELLDVPETTVAYRLRAARKELKNYLQEDIYE